MLPGWPLPSFPPHTPVRSLAAPFGQGTVIGPVPGTSRPAWPRHRDRRWPRHFVRWAIGHVEAVDERYLLATGAGESA